MASALQVQPTTAPSSLPPTRSTWPAERSSRWGLRLALAAPLVVLAWWFDGRGFVSAAHARLLAGASDLAAGGPDLAGLDAAYPVVPTLLALVLPGGALGLCVAAALAASGILQRTWSVLVQRGLPRPVVLCLLLPLFAVPAVAYLASESVAAVGSLTLLTVALEGLAWFTLARHTEAGFVVGLALAGAFLFDPLALFFALTIALMAVLVARERFRAERGAAFATVAVMVFPIVFLAACWSFLQWTFTGSAFSWFLVTPDTLAFDGGVWHALGAALVSVGGSVAVAPLFVVVGLLYWREPLTMAGQLVAAPVLVLAIWIGLPATAVSAYVLLTLVALTHVPRGLRRWQQGALAGTALVQLALVWAFPPLSPGFEQWVQAIVVGAV